jgi:NADP-dependent aldehyde dehydrogenase
MIPLGPVAVFGASNFPLAFSVAGGDTASALAAGCPVVVKGHPAHPGTSEMVGRAIRDAVARKGMPEGVFSLLTGPSVILGQTLVADPRIKAVGFTGSRVGGLALVKLAAQRSDPIPVYAEMSSINPVVLLPGALASGTEALAKGFIGSLTLGAGQFCTNPGLVLALDGPSLDRFLQAAVAELGRSPPAVMLTPGIHKAFETGVAALAAQRCVVERGRGRESGGVNQGVGALFETSAEGFVANPMLHNEVFGAAALVVRCPDLEALVGVLEAIEAQLTATLHLDQADYPLAEQLLPFLERKVGRVLANAWPTGVEVCHAMVHGGPFPATSDSRTTSVGSLAIARFLRPVCYQGFPDDLLPPALRQANPLNLTRMIDGQIMPASAR